MVDKNGKIIELKKFVNFIGDNINFENEDDIRNITVEALRLTTENFLFSIILSSNLNSLDYCKKNISENINEEYLPIIEDNFEGFIKNAFFINYFVQIENHIRQIALHFERSVGSINEISIMKTFKNLMDLNKLEYFRTISNDDLNLFEFYCFLRNTMHNAGFHNRDDKSLIIHDSESIFDKDELKIYLIKDSPNSISFIHLLLLHEQIIKLIFKFNVCIPIEEVIAHKFSSIGFNE